MILKPRIDISVAVIFAGAFFVFVGFASAIAMASLYSLLPAGLGMLSLLFIAGGLAALWHRKRLTITIDPSGITIPTGTIFRPGRSVHIPRAAMATIARDESVRAFPDWTMGFRDLGRQRPPSEGWSSFLDCSDLPENFIASSRCVRNIFLAFRAEEGQESELDA